MDDLHRDIVAVKKSRQCGQTATLEAAQFQQELGDRLKQWADTVPDQRSSLSRLLTACGWERATTLTPDPPYETLHMGGSSFHHPGEYILIDRAMDADEMRILSAAMASRGTVAVVDGLVNTFSIDGETFDAGVLARLLEEADISVRIFDRGDRVLESMPLRAEELLSFFIEQEPKPAADARGYLRHDPTKNTKRRMRRMKGKKA